MGMLIPSTVLDAGITLVSKVASCLHGYFATKSEITKQVKGSSSLHRPSFSFFSYTHAPLHDLTLILRNLAKEEGKKPGDASKSLNPGD